MRKTPAESVKAHFRKFDRAHLFLPDGWYGRPYDSLFSLASAEDLPDGLEIELEGNRKLLFTGEVDVIKSRFEGYPALRIEGFRALAWRPNQGVLPDADYGADGPPLFLISKK